MAVIRAQGLEAFLRKPGTARVLLIYGGDFGAVKELAKRAVVAFAGSLDDPFSVQRIEETAIAADPALLMDEYASQSMLGGKRAIWVTGSGDALMKSLTPVLESELDGNMIVVEAGVLAKSSRLRNGLEGHDRATVCPVYDPDARDLGELVDSMCAAAALAIAPDARARLLDLIGADRALSRSEVDKLVLYCHGTGSISLEDVESACGDASAVSQDDLTDAAFGGDIEAADGAYWSLLAEGTDPSRLLGALSNHAGVLQGLQGDVARGVSADQAVKTARPPVFFKRQRLVASQLRMWDFESLASVQASVSNAIKQSRQYAALAGPAGNRAVLSLARLARSLRQQAN
ncbi:MAG: DNA polymerase III subunit delta [Rhizobiales bacterium]|nr:DNA polymerase III subunit delta [Hyphomicrobiales bacterium]